MQFSASILDREAPVDAGTIRIAFFLECMDRSVERQVNTSREPGQSSLKYHLTMNIQWKLRPFSVAVW